MTRCACGVTQSWGHGTRSVAMDERSEDGGQQNSREATKLNRSTRHDIFYYKFNWIFQKNNSIMEMGRYRNSVV